MRIEFQNIVSHLIHSHLSLDELAMVILDGLYTLSDSLHTAQARVTVFSCTTLVWFMNQFFRKSFSLAACVQCEEEQSNFFLCHTPRADNFCLLPGKKKHGSPVL